jgi:hypothetical protein
MGKLILTIGLIGLCHAAFSATQHRNFIRLTEHDFDESMKKSGAITSLPLDILLQTILCLLLSCFGVISVAAKFRPIKITSEWENKTWDNISNRSSFYTFNHRGKYLFSSEIIKHPIVELSSSEKEAILNRYKSSTAVHGKKQAVVEELPPSSSDEESGSGNEVPEYSGESDQSQKN